MRGVAEAVRLGARWGETQERDPREGDQEESVHDRKD